MAPFVLKQYYFTFGSNMHIGQMSARCPNSVYEGTAILSNWRWQINTRGVANIVQATPSTVQGLVFSITEGDERALDRYEGVRRGLYKKTTVCAQLRPVVSIATAHLASSIEASDLHSFSPKVQGHHIEVQIPALTYVSSTTEDGLIRAEYVQRMWLAMQDAQALGVSPRYLREVLEPIVNGRTLESAQLPQKVRRPLL
jgi:hypothetical protein